MYLGVQFYSATSVHFHSAIDTLQRGVKENGGKLYRVVIVRTHWHHYTIKIRCSTKKAVEHTDTVRHTDHSQQTEKVQQTDQSQQTDQTNTTGSSKRGGGT